jgi:hypothetical protein
MNTVIVSVVEKTYDNSSHHALRLGILGRKA